MFKNFTKPEYLSGMFLILVVLLLVLFFYGKKENFVLQTPQTTPDQYLSAYQTIPQSTITNNTTVVNPDNIPEFISTYYSGTSNPVRNKIYVIDITSFFSGKAYNSFSNIVKRWPSVTYKNTDNGIVYVKAPYPVGREQIIPFQHNRIIVMDINTQNLDSYTFDCTNKAQAAFVRSLLIKDGAVLNTVAAQENKELWAQKEQAEALEELANYNHGYNTGYSLGLANSCMTDPSASNSNSTSSFDTFSTVIGYAGSAASALKFGKSVLSAI